MSAANKNASVEWTMRDFSTIEKDVPELDYDEDGNYVYKNGDASVDEVIAIDNDNTLIIPAGTQLDIAIELGTTKITKKYTVTSQDVLNVKRP